MLFDNLDTLTLLFFSHLYSVFCPLKKILPVWSITGALVTCPPPEILL